MALLSSYGTERLAALAAAQAEGRLRELNKLRSKVAALEAQSSVLGEWQEAREQLFKCVPASSVSAQVAELKAYLEAVCDADLLADPVLQGITTQHAVTYATSVARQLGDSAVCTAKGAHGLLELAASALAMFSQRPAAHSTLMTCGSVSALIALTHPSHTPSCVESAAVALGNMAADSSCRHAVRTGGGVGSLVRLLKPDCSSRMQSSACAALSLLAARDAVVQDSCRYLGAVDLLVELVATARPAVAEVARYCLASLKVNNPRNAADVTHAVRTNANLAKDFLRLREAAQLLGCGVAPPQPTPKAVQQADKVAAAWELGYEAGEAAAIGSPLLSAYRPASPARPLSALAISLDACLGDIKATLEASSRFTGSSKPSAALRSSLAALRRAAAYSPPAAGPTGKHPALWTASELGLLMEHAGFDKIDARSCMRAGLTGADVLELDDHSIAALATLPMARARRLARLLQQATALFDCVATRTLQPRLSEVELRLWLVAQGCSAAEAGRVLKLLRSLVMGGGGGSDSAAAASGWVTAWDWVAGWQWVTHAMEVYNVDWRAAAGLL